MKNQGHDQDRVIAVIPARRDSKGFPGKNVSLLAGKRLFEHSIETAKQVTLIDLIVVTTNDLEVLEIAKKSGVLAHKRSEEAATDSSRDTLFIKNLLDDNIITDRDIVVLLRPTHPVRKPRTVEEAIKSFQENRSFSSLRSMKISTEIVFKSWYIDSNGLAQPIYDQQKFRGHDLANAPRQELPKTYYQDGYVDIFPVKTVLEFDSITGPKVLPFLVEEFSHDIDSKEDLKVIEAYLENAFNLK